MSRSSLPPFPPCCASCEDLGRLVGGTPALPAIGSEQVHGLQFKTAHQQAGGATLILQSGLCIGWLVLVHYLK